MDKNLQLVLAVIFGVIFVFFTYHFLGRNSQYSQSTKLIAFFVLFSIFVFISMMANRSKSKNNEK
jgi:multisubunit Na+/H+ antiporter MnhE subunit